MSQLFRPVTIPSPSGSGLTLRNRAVLAPMCQYSVAEHDGTPHDWHLAHLGARAAGGFGLVIAEASAIEADGRISPGDVGIYTDEHVTAWSRIVRFIRAQGAAAGIQLAHAGLKASTYEALPGRPAGSLSAADGAWQSKAPSVVELPNLAAPREIGTGEIPDIIEMWVAAARRADEAGFDFIQLHGAHGYLLHQFLSPQTNKRTDEYGGSFENRTRLVREVVTAVRAAWPSDKPLGIRLSGEDWVDGAWGIADTVALSQQLVELGVSAIDLSSGGIGAYTGPMGPGYQVPLAQAVREAIADPTVFVTAVGLITEPQQAEQIVLNGQADGVSIARAALIDPNWAAKAARALRASTDEAPIAAQYWRAAWWASATQNEVGPDTNGVGPHVTLLL